MNRSDTKEEEIRLGPDSILLNKPLWNRINLENKYNREWRKIILGLEVNAKLEIGMNYMNDNNIKAYINIPYIFDKVFKYEDNIYLFFKLYLSFVNALIQSHRHFNFNASDSIQLFQNINEKDVLYSLKSILTSSTILTYDTNPLLLLQFQNTLLKIKRYLKEIDSNQQYHTGIANDLLGLNTMLTLLNPINYPYLNLMINQESTICFLTLFKKMTNNINSLRKIQQTFIEVNKTKRAKIYFLFFCAFIAAYYMNMFIFQNEVLGINRRKAKTKSK